MSKDVGEFVNSKLNTAVPWNDLVASGNLQKIIHAIVQRLDRQDQAIAAANSTVQKSQASQFTVLPSNDVEEMKNRLEVLENVTLQQRVETLDKSNPLKNVADKSKTAFNLSKHVIPLTQIKGRLESCESGLIVTGNQVDEVNQRVLVIAQGLDACREDIAKCALKEDLNILEAKHEKLQKQVDQMGKDLIERLEKKIKEVQDQVDAHEVKITRCMDEVDVVRREMGVMKQTFELRFVPLEQTLPLKADKADVDAAIQALKDQIEKLNIEEIMEMARRANERIDLMDERCDKMEDNLKDLKDYVLKKEKELEDLQLEKQIENLRRELAEAKSGVFVKATQRIDTLAKEMEETKTNLMSTTGQVQVNRESIVELQDALRAAGATNITSQSGSSVKSEIARLQADVLALEEKYAQAVETFGKNKDVEMGIDELKTRLDEINQAKADKIAVEIALTFKADKESVARDTELNQRAVDEALSTMNAGTHGIQQLLEQQEGVVSRLMEQLSKKLDREELRNLEENMKQARSSGENVAEMILTKYGSQIDDAAGMVRPLQKAMCISCNRPLKQEIRNALPALPLLPAAKETRTPPYVPRRPATASSSPNKSSTELVEVTEYSLRSAGGSHTSPRNFPPKRRLETPEIKKDVRKSVELVGEDGKIYHGRLPSGSDTPSS